MLSNNNEIISFIQNYRRAAKETRSIIVMRYQQTQQENVDNASH